MKNINNDRKTNKTVDQVQDDMACVSGEHVVPNPTQILTPHPNPVLDYSGCREVPSFPTPYEFRFASLYRKSALPQGARGRIAVKFGSGYRKVAFTLAEILITLGIIGIVAAMTMPSLFTHIQKVQNAAKIKKVYSMLSQAEKKAQDNGCYNADGMNSLTWFKTYLAPELKVAEYTTMSKLKQKYHIQYKQLSGANETGLRMMYTSAHVVILQDGTLLFLPNYVLGESTEDKDFGVSIGFDINGMKLPNQWGKDTFLLTFNENKGSVVPYGYGSACDGCFGEQYDREKIKEVGTLQYGCNKRARGMWCLALFVADGFKFAKDYPW